jgi:hypothetical protein
MKAKDRFEILLENIEGKIDTVIEIVTDHGPRLTKIEGRLDTIETDVALIKDAIRHQGAEITKLKG